MPKHACNETTIDYAHVVEGNLRCNVCGRRWYLTPSGWQMEPREPMPR